jgi:hypothetical protein
MYRHYPVGKLFTRDEWDQLSSPTANHDDVTHIQLYLPSRARVDFAPLIDGTLSVAGLTVFAACSLARQPVLIASPPPSVVGARVRLNRTPIVPETCPLRPQQQNGQPCHARQAFPLEQEWVDLIRRETALMGDQDPAVVAAILQSESNFNLFIVNAAERARCLALGSRCPRFRWGKGLGQFGNNNAHLYGLDWNLEVPVPASCGGNGARSVLCLREMVERCQPYQDDELKPINCPQYSIRAVALHLARTIPERQFVWVKNRLPNQQSRITRLDVVPALKQTPEETLRSRLASYNRGIRLVNSYVEFYDLNGRFPASFGEAWASPRQPLAPDVDSGYEVLKRQFINRCYVWSMAGLCGGVPNNSLVAQYRRQF